jgi:hypothetical protein
MRRINILRLAIVSGKTQHSARDLVLRLRWETIHRFERLFEKLGHGPNILVSAGRHKELGYNPAFASATAWRLATRSIEKRSIASLNRR